MTPTDLDTFFAALYLGTSAVSGLLAVWLTQAVTAVWQDVTGRTISATKRRWLSIAMPAAPVLLGYAGLVLLGDQPFTTRTVLTAIMFAAGAVMGKQVIYAGWQSWQKPSGPTNITFTGKTDIGAVAGGDIGTLTHDKETPP